MKTTFDEFITDNPNQKEQFDKEYEEFLLSEFIIQKMEEENIQDNYDYMKQTDIRG
jgi:hypothetical protein